MQFLINAALTACIIAFASWLSGRSPLLAGFFVALPLSTAIVLPMSYVEHGSLENTVLLAKSIAIAVPLTLSFFVPFLLVERFGLGFWQAYPLAFVCLAVGFVLHQAVTGLIGGLSS